MAILLSAALSGYAIALLNFNNGKLNWTVASLCISALADVGLSCLWHLEQRRSNYSSNLATLYLVGAVVCDAIYLAMPHKTPNCTACRYPILIRFCAHGVLLAIECSGWRAIPSQQGETHAAEDQHNPLSRVFFTWINAILSKGYKRILTHEDMPPLCAEMRAETTRQRMLEAWELRGT